MENGKVFITKKKRFNKKSTPLCLEGIGQDQKNGVSPNAIIWGRLQKGEMK